MATVRWYLVNGVDANGWQALSTTAQAAVVSNAGWVVGTGLTNSSELQANAERSAGFTANTVPDGTLDTTLKDAFRTPILNGTFASANWTFQFTVQSTVQGGAADGQIVFRLIKADADGSSATEITAAQQSASVCTNVSTTNVNGTLTFNPGAITFAGQYLFIQIAWKRTGAGGMTTTNMRLVTGSTTSVGTTILSSDYVPRITGSHVASTTVIPSATGITNTGPAENTAGYTAQGPFIGQQFTGHAGTLTGVSVSLECDLAPDSDAVRIEVCAATPDGSVLTTSSPLALTSLSPAPTWYLFPLTPTVALAPAAPYVFRLIRSGGASTAIVDVGLTGNTYSGGAHVEWGSADPADWYTNTDSDLHFQLHGVGGWNVEAVPPGGGSAQAVTGAFVTSTSVVYSPQVVTPGAVTLTGATLATGAQLFAGTVSTAGVAQGVTGTTLASGAAVTAGTVAPGAVTTTGATIGSGVIVRAGSVSPGAVTVTGTTLTSSAILRTGTVTTLTAVSGATLPSGLVLRAGTVTTTTSVTGTTRASTLSVFPGTVSLTVPGTVGGVMLVSGAQLFPGVVSGVAVPVAADQPFMWLM